MNRRAWLACGLAAYACALVATAPATLLGSRIAVATAGRLQLADPRGTLWAGAASLELRDADGATLLAQPVAWRLRPAALATGRFDYGLAIDAGGADAAMVLSRSGVRVSGIDLDLPASVLATAMPALAALGPGGRLRVVVDDLSFARGRAVGGASVEWRAATSSLSAVAPLGDYALRLQARGDTFGADLRTLAGPLELTGHGVWRFHGASTFAAIARVPPALQPTLSPLLRLVAVERADGSFAWQAD